MNSNRLPFGYIPRGMFVDSVHKGSKDVHLLGKIIIQISVLLKWLFDWIPKRSNQTLALKDLGKAVNGEIINFFSLTPSEENYLYLDFFFQPQRGSESSCKCCLDQMQWIWLCLLHVAELEQCPEKQCLFSTLRPKHNPSLCQGHLIEKKSDVELGVRRLGFFPLLSKLYQGSLLGSL